MTGRDAPLVPMRRGDVVAVEVLHSMQPAGGLGEEWSTYRLGVVLRATRDGWAREVLVDRVFVAATGGDRMRVDDSPRRVGRVWLIDRSLRPAAALLAGGDWPSVGAVRDAVLAAS